MESLCEATYHGYFTSGLYIHKFVLVLILMFCERLVTIYVVDTMSNEAGCSGTSAGGPMARLAELRMRRVGVLAMSTIDFQFAD